MTGWPRNPLHRVLFAMSAWDGGIGASARRKLNRRRAKVSLRDFDRRLADLRPGDICLDLGANLGVFTEKLAQTGAEVHAFEPDPHCYSALKARFAVRNNVMLHQAAVARCSGRATLRRTHDFAQAPDLQSQSSSIAAQHAGLYQADGIEVETRAFKCVVNSFDRPVAIVKMDIEGAEFDILDHVLEAPEQFPIGALFVETHERLFPERIGMVRDVRRLNWDAALPFPIDTFWP